jgi:hypothetical protein
LTRSAISRSWRVERASRSSRVAVSVSPSRKKSITYRSLLRCPWSRSPSMGLR